MKYSKYVIISPVRNEGKYLEVTIAGVVAQTALPLRWVIVDDGSGDDTRTIVENAATACSWIELLARKDRGFRQSGVGVVEAYYEGFARVEDLPWDYVVKLDGDVRLQASYFAQLLHEFERDSRLGIASGDIYNEVNGKLVLDSPDDPAFHVRGAAKIYRRACWDAIGGMPRVTGFDCIDNVKARMLGWNTKRFPRPEAIHLRRTGKANGVWRNSFKDGLGANAIGYHPLFLLLKCLKRIASGGSGIGALGQLCGYVQGYCSDIPRIRDKELIKYLRRQQINRLLGRETIWR